MFWRMWTWAQDVLSRKRRKREAEREGVLFRGKTWYNYRAMLSKNCLADKTFIEIFDEDARYIDCPGIGGEVILNSKGRRYRYRVVGFDNDSRDKDWLYDTDHINPVIEYIGKEYGEERI